MPEDDTNDREGLGFKVEDKRRFDSTGQARGAGADEGEPEDAAAKTGPEAPEQAPPHPPETEPGREWSEASDELPGELNFSSFVVGLASQAFMFLGLAPDAQSGVIHKDLGQARAMIDILSMLAEKTQGNLTEDEARMMEEMLYELRMQYVREMRGEGGTKENSE